MAEHIKQQVAISPMAERVIQHSLDLGIEKKLDESSRDPSDTSIRETSIANEILQKIATNDDAQSTMSAQGSNTNFGFFPVPKNCRVSPTKPFKLNLATNILFGFASTFTV